MPDGRPVQKIDLIVAHPLTERRRTWLIKRMGRRLAAIGTANATNGFPPRREFDRMTTAMTLRAFRPSTAPGVGRALALAGLTLLPFCATANAQEAPAAAAAAAAAGTTASIESKAVPKAEPPPVVRRESPAGYMKRVGNELLAASRSGSATQFAMVLNSNADVPSIGLSALGDYARSLPKNDRPIYFTGMINFIARYASKEAPKYPVARFIVTAQSKEDARGTYVDSRITLASGDGYDVRWLIVKRGETYKVRDAQVVGFWMTSFLDNLFQSFISDNGGNPKALVVALNR